MLAAMRDASNFVIQSHEEFVKITAERNKMTPQWSVYIVGLYKFKMDIEPRMVEGAKVEEAWMRGKQRLRGNPIDWDKILDRSYFDRATAMKKEVYSYSV